MLVLHSSFLPLLLLRLLVLPVVHAATVIIISEVAFRGSAGVCQGEW